MQHSSSIVGLFALVLALSLLPAGCRPSSPPGRQYSVRGQVMQVDAVDRTITLRHDDIEGFMPAMTMPFKVKDASLLAGRQRGDLVTATLIVSDTDAYLVALKSVGHSEVAPVTAAASGPPVDILEPGSLVPSADLIDASGRPFPLSNLHGSAVAITFVYTRCPLPDFCPAMDRLFSAASSRLRRDPVLRDAVRLLSISFDPQYDTPSVLAAHSRAVGADGEIWRFATAPQPVLDAWAPRFGVVVARDADAGITHNLRTAVVDRQGRLVKIYNGSSWTVDELMTDLKRAATIKE